MRKLSKALSGVIFACALFSCEVACADEKKMINLFPITYESGFEPSKPVYVIGHNNPDSDTVFSAIALADLLTQLGIDAKPALSGEPNKETEHVLRKFGIAAPEILKNADGKQFVLVDHSQLEQSIDNMTPDKILGIVDHHAIGNITTSGTAIDVTLPLGSTATVVYGMFAANGAKIDQTVATMLLSAILSDTVGLKSPTTTPYDKAAADELSAIADIKDISSYTRELLEAKTSLEGMSARQIIEYDYKKFESGNTSFSIGVVEAFSHDKISQYRKSIEDYMKDNFASFGVDYVFMMLTNDETLSTEIIAFGKDADKAVKAAFDTKEYPVILENCISRKKQVLPPLMNYFDEREKK